MLKSIRKIAIQNMFILENTVYVEYLDALRNIRNNQSVIFQRLIQTFASLRCL